MAPRSTTTSAPKSSLIREIYRQLFEGLNKSRIKALDDYEASLKGKKAAPEQIVRAWIASTVTFSTSEEGGGIYWVQSPVSRLWHEPGIC